METKLKDQIVAAAKRYITGKGLSQAAFARLCDVSPSYISNMLNGVYEYKASGDKAIAIADRYFAAVAARVGMSLVAAYWRTVETPQFIEMISALEDARMRGVAKMIIGETGCGKTYSINKFIEANPVDVFRITVSNQHKIQDVTEELGSTMDVPLGVRTRKAYRMRAITERLREIRAKGGQPLVIVDEAENLTHGMIGLCKGIYDAINEQAAFVLIGTGELIEKLDKMEHYGYKFPGIPQFRRRFKAGTIYLTPIDRKRHYDAFFADVRDTELRTLLRGLCDNYGELHDFLEPALREADESGVPLTDNFFRVKYKIASIGF